VPKTLFGEISAHEKTKLIQQKVTTFGIVLMPMPYPAIMPWLVKRSRSRPSNPPAKSCLRIPTGDEASL
jgi:hypothetical protein